MNSRRCRKQFVFYSDLSSDFMLVPHMSVNLTGEKYSMMHKDLKDLERSERSETKIAALERDDKRLDPITRVLTVLARISERGCQTLHLHSFNQKSVSNLVKCSVKSAQIDVAHENLEIIKKTI